MSNPTPITTGQITTLAGKNIAGLTALGTSLGITQLTAAGMQTALTAFTTADTAFNAARSALNTAYVPFHAADDALTAWLGDVRAVFTTDFGARWNTQWAQAGFTNASTAVPSTIDDRLGLALRVVGFLTAQPDYENAGADVTAAIGGTLRTAAVTTQQAAAAASTLSQQKMDARTAAVAPLLAEMRLLVNILTMKLAADDARWTTFGLNAPASDVTPGQPQNLSAVAAGFGDFVVQCDPVPLATRYRWRTRIVGVQQNFLLAKSTADATTMLGEFPPGATVEIIVQAVNGTLQGPASDVLAFTMPLANAPAATKAASRAEVPAPKPHRNGNGKANGNGHALQSRTA